MTLNVAHLYKFCRIFHSESTGGTIFVAMASCMMPSPQFFQGVQGLQAMCLFNWQYQGHGEGWRMTLQGCCGKVLRLVVAAK